jgi:serine/threonine protein phosphatase PrpC
MGWLSPVFVQALVLACDGVWDVCDNDEVRDIVRSIVGDGEEQMNLICEEMVDQCLLRYSKDNISTVLVAFPPLFERYHKNGPGVEGRRKKREEQEEGRETGGLDADEGGGK